MKIDYLSSAFLQEQESNMQILSFYPVARRELREQYCNEENNIVITVLM